MRPRKAKRSKTGRGRPPRTDNPKRLVVWVPGIVRRFVEAQSEQEGRTMGALVSEALETYRRIRGIGRKRK